MIRTGRERKLRRQIRLLKGRGADAPRVERKLKIVSQPVADVFVEEIEGKTVKVSAEKMKQSYQGGRPSLKDLVSAGYPTSR